MKNCWEGASVSSAFFFLADISCHQVRFIIVLTFKMLDQLCCRGRRDEIIRHEREGFDCKQKQKVALSERRIIDCTLTQWKLRKWRYS